MQVIHNIKDKENGCPWGHKCDACNHYKPLYRNTRTGDMVQEWDCQINNLVTLMSQTKERTMGVQAAIEGLTNEVAEAAADSLEQKEGPRLINHG